MAAHEKLIISWYVDWYTIRVSRARTAFNLLSGDWIWKEGEILNVVVVFKNSMMIKISYHFEQNKITYLWFQR